jgi:hypothetical protein
MRKLRRLIPYGDKINYKLILLRLLGKFSSPNLKENNSNCGMIFNIKAGNIALKMFR